MNPRQRSPTLFVGLCVFLQRADVVVEKHGVPQSIVSSFLPDLERLGAILFDELLFRRYQVRRYGRATDCDSSAPVQLVRNAEAEQVSQGLQTR